MNDVRQRHAITGKFRVIATNISLTRAWIVGDYMSFRDAKEKVDNDPLTDVVYYIHSDSSRVLYTKRGDVNA